MCKSYICISPKTSKIEPQALTGVYSISYSLQILKTNDRVYYSFPTPENIAKPDTEEILRGLGFGYRAKYIKQAAEKVKLMMCTEFFKLYLVQYNTKGQII